MNQQDRKLIMAGTTIVFVILILVALVRCGKEIVYIGADGKPITPPVPGECLPKAVADAGSDMYIAYSADTSVVLPIPDRAQIGTKLPEGLTAQWEPAMGLSDPNASQPIANPKANTVYTLTVKNPKCGTEAKAAMTVWVLQEKKRAGDMEVEIDGKVYPTGYTELHAFADQYRASYMHMGTGYYRTLKAATDTIDLTIPNFHVNRQPNGSCWAEGARTAGEHTYYYVTKKHEHISTQRIIDCSGFGSAASGGQISIDDFVTHGLVKELEYPYNGRDNRCKKDVLGFYKAKSTFFLRGSSGNRPKRDEILQAHISFGASEDCGNAGALRSGGYVKSPGGGGTNHCWAGVGIKKHPTEGWFCRLDTNSWGADWGGGSDLSNGQGCYGFKDDDTMSTGIIAEIKFMDMGSPCPPPKADAGPDKTILLLPKLPDFAIVGIGGSVIDHTYQWSVVSGDMNAHIESPISPVTLVRPVKTTRFKLTVKNKCAEAHAEMKVTVWGVDKNGRRTEVK